MFIEHYRARLSEPPFAALRPLMLMHDLFAGRLDELRKAIAPLEENEEALHLTYEGALACLAGHNDQARERDGFHLSLSHQASETTLFLEPETPSRYRVIEFSQKLLAVQELLGGKGLTVPAKGRDQLLQLVRRDDPALPIRAEFAELAQPAQAADPTPVLG